LLLIAAAFSAPTARATSIVDEVATSHLQSCARFGRSKHSNKLQTFTTSGISDLARLPQDYRVSW